MSDEMKYSLTEMKNVKEQIKLKIILGPSGIVLLTQKIFRATFIQRHRFGNKTS